MFLSFFHFFCFFFLLLYNHHILAFIINEDCKLCMGGGWLLVCIVGLYGEFSSELDSFECAYAVEAYYHGNTTHDFYWRLK